MYGFLILPPGGVILIWWFLCILFLFKHNDLSKIFTFSINLLSISNTYVMVPEFSRYASCFISRTVQCSAALDCFLPNFYKPFLWNVASKHTLQSGLNNSKCICTLPLWHLTKNAKKQLLKESPDHVRTRGRRNSDHMTLKTTFS